MRLGRGWLARERLLQAGASLLPCVVAVYCVVEGHRVSGCEGAEPVGNGPLVVVEASRGRGAAIVMPLNKRQRPPTKSAGACPPGIPCGCRSQMCPALTGGARRRKSWQPMARMNEAERGDVVPGWRKGRRLRRRPPQNGSKARGWDRAAWLERASKPRTLCGCN